MAKETRKLLFLKSTGVLIGEITADTDESVMDFSKFYIKEVGIDSTKQEYWSGDYATGQVLSKLDKPIITESVLNYSTNLKVLEVYSIHKQLNILVDMLDKNASEKTPEFVAMRDFLKTARQEHLQKIQAYSSNPEAYIWVSKEQEEAMLSKKVV
jgi:hypothetical protein